MTAFRRLSVLIVPLLLGAAGTVPGRAQTPSGGRFAFADTTLLRDTLGLHFNGLFPLADSLGMVPDTLRGLSIRYRYPLLRIVALAESLGVPVDSVGPILLRERFNPLASAGRRVDQFTYSSNYSVQQTSSNWANTADYNLVRGAFFLRNSTNIGIERYRSGGYTQIRDSRNAQTESGWRFSPNFSLGGRANLDRFSNNGGRASTSTEGETKNEYQFSMRSRQLPAKGLTSEANVFGGLLDLAGFQQEKRGLSGDVNGRIRYTRGTWLAHDTQGQITGNRARTRGGTNSSARLTTADFSNNLRGTLGLFQSAPASLNVNYALRNIRVETPSADSVVRVRTNSKNLDIAGRLRLDNERYANITRHFGTNRQASVQTPSSQNSRSEDGWSTSGRLSWRQFSLDGNFNLSRANSEYPRRVVTGGYAEASRSRAVDGTLTWNLSRQVNAKLTGNVRLDSYRYNVIGRFPSPPVNRESYQQSYRLDANYIRSERMNSTIGMTVSRSLFLNLPAASTAANSETREYRADWRWSYRIFTGLTATQRNQVSASYTLYTNPSSQANNRLGIDYSSYTTLNAVVTPRFSMDLTHNARYQPSGNYVRYPDGFEYLRKSDENQSFSLQSRVSYTPFTGISLLIQPEYFANDRLAAGPSGIQPQRAGRTLKFSGGASLNLPLGSGGQLTGDIRRTFSDDRSTTYSNGVPRPSPRSEVDFWNGALSVSWQL